jgi:hypothetical protein
VNCSDQFLQVDINRFYDPSFHYSFQHSSPVLTPDLTLIWGEHVSDTARVHLALQERTPDIDLVTLLAVGVVKRAGKQCRAIVIEKWLPRQVRFADLARRGRERKRQRAVEGIGWLDSKGVAAAQTACLTRRRDFR